jgi:hypothetical protein
VPVTGLAILALTWTRSRVGAALLIAAIGGSSGTRHADRVGVAAGEDVPPKRPARIFGWFNTGTMGRAILGMILFGWAVDRYDPYLALSAMAESGSARRSSPH